MAVGSSVQLNEGTGIRIAASATYTENALTVRDEKVILGEPYLASYISSASPSLATSASHLFQLVAGAANKIRVRCIVLYPGLAATTATLATLELFRLTTAGTTGVFTATPQPLNPADGAAGAAVITLPSSKGTEAALPIWRGNFPAWQTMPTSGAIPEPLVLEFDGMRLAPLVIAAGTSNGIALKIVTGIAAASITFDIWFDEVPF